MDLWFIQEKPDNTILPCFFKLPVFSRDTLTRPIVCLLDLLGPSLLAQTYGKIPRSELSYYRVAR